MTGYEKALAPRELAKLFPKSETEIRACFRKSSKPCPCVRSGGKRPAERAYPSVFATYLAYEQGVAKYAEVELAARQCLMGARS